MVSTAALLNEMNENLAKITKKTLLYNLEKFPIHSFVNKDFVHCCRIDVFSMIYLKHFSRGCSSYMITIQQRKG